jgi:hypothetical protein
MQYENTEPRVWFGHVTHKANFLRGECSVEALVANVPQSVDCNFGLSFGDENRVDGYVIDGRALAKVVNKVANAK